MVNAFEATLRQAATNLDELGAQWAMIGGVAVSARSIPRFTKDVDFVVAVPDDPAAETVIRLLGARGYAPREIVEHEYLDRLATARLVREPAEVAIDLLFASSGIEEEIVAAATRLEILPALTVPVATTGHLVALKVLAGRNQDLTDLDALLQSAGPDDLAAAREAVELIVARGFNRDRDLLADLERVVS